MHHDLERELSFHLAERADHLQADGMSDEQSARQARRQFGNYTLAMERTRDMDVNSALESVSRSLRHAVRGLVKTPTFSITVVLMLALGIGANSAVFSAINAVLLRPLPFPHGSQLMSLSQWNPKNPQPFVAPARLEDWNRLNHSFQAITGYYMQDDAELSGDLPEKLKHALVAPRFLQVWGVAPERGRDFTPLEERFGGPNAVLISNRLWQRGFGGNPATLGKTLRLGQFAYTIVGIMPASFRFPDHDVDLWSPSPVDAPYAQNRESTWFTTIGRLQPGVTLAQARADLSTVQANLGRQYPQTDAQITAGIEPLKELIAGGVRKSLWILFGSVSLLLLIACTNIAALLLSRAASRQHEISIRFSLGASRTSVAAQVLTEVFVLALTGAALGLFLANGASAVFRMLAKDLPRLEEIRLDWRIVLYSMSCAVAVTLLCGALPSLRGAGQVLASSLAQGSRSQVAPRNPVQFALAGVQVALAMTLLSGAGLLLRSFQQLARVSPGFEPEHVLTFHISTSWGETADLKAVAQWTERLLDGLRAMPGIESAATTAFLPGVPFQFQLEIRTPEGRAASEPKMLAENRWVSPAYFATMRIPVLAGELCRDEPNTSSAMVNRSFANRYWNGSAPLGRHIVPAGNPYQRAAGIRGLVGDAREAGLEHASVPTVYWCNDASQPGTYFLVRTHGEPSAMMATIRRKIHELEPLRSVYDLTPLTDHIADAYAENRLRTILLSFFAVTAVSLACVGLYGTLSYLVHARQRELALRLALGAMRTQVIEHFLVRGLGIALLGGIAGLALAAATAGLLSGMLYGVSPSDPATLAGVGGLILTVSMLASLLPAIRAARLEPMRILREE
jgi:putative ABC transport system permease protein